MIVTDTEILNTQARRLSDVAETIRAGLIPDSEIPRTRALVDGLAEAIEDAREDAQDPEQRHALAGMRHDLNLCRLAMDRQWQTARPLSVVRAN